MSIKISYGCIVIGMFYYHPLTLSLNFPAHLKVTILLFSRIISFPVAGFRPFLDAFSFTQNLPNPDIITSSPDAKVNFMISRSSSTVSFASGGERMVFSAIFSMIVVLVSANLGTGLLCYLI